MALAAEYHQQLAWRSWATALDALPPLSGKLVLDLGCGRGDVAGLFVARGARVIGFDTSDELLAAARTALPGVDFRRADLRSLPDLDEPADVLWCSFGAAYFPDLPPVLRSWRRLLRPGGFAALVEVDDLFGHEPVTAETRVLFDHYVAEALARGFHDFRTGRKLRSSLEAAGFEVAGERDLPDLELAFSGPARSDVVAAWATRLDRLGLLAEFAGPRAMAVREDFLRCLASPEHRTSARVVLCMGFARCDHACLPC